VRGQPALSFERLRGKLKTGQLREICGFGLLIVGLIGGLIPVIPGSPMVIAGIALLGSDHPRIRPSIRRLEQWCDLLASKWRILLGRNKP
jgi:uncharacterized membrane protein YbaN (DUF454 family)